MFKDCQTSRGNTVKHPNNNSKHFIPVFCQVKAWPSSNGAAWETKSYKAHARLPAVYGQ